MRKLSLGDQAKPSALSARVLGMEPLPAADHWLVAAASAMGLGNQHSVVSLVDLVLAAQRHTHTSAAEGEQIDRNGLDARVFKLQQTILGIIHRPELNRVASSTGTAGVGHLVQRDGFPPDR